MKFFNKLLVLSFAMFCFSCNEDEIAENIQVSNAPENVNENSSVVSQTEDFKISESEAMDNAMEFLSHLNGGLSKGGGQISFESIVPLRKSKSVLKKSLAEEDSSDFEIGFDTLFYAINLADNQGYIIAASDKRTDPIYAFVDDGSFCLDSLESDEYTGISMFLNYAVDTELDDIANYSDTVSISKKSLSKAWQINVKKAALLDTKWGQRYPYNYYCNGKLTGCVVTAIAQIMSYYKTPSSVSWNSNGYGNSTSMNWSRIISDCKSNNGRLISSTQTSALEVANLMRMLGIAFNADYGSNSTSVNSKKALKKINSVGWLSAGSLNDFDIVKIQRALSNNQLVFARGYRTKRKLFGYKNGHAWVYDGYINASQNGKTSFMVHCNWGWNGTANGYYIAKSFNVKTGPELIDSKDDNSTSNDDWNYKYKCQYSIMTK